MTERKPGTPTGAPGLLVQYGELALVRAGEAPVEDVRATLIFALVFKVVPDAVIAWRHVWAGAFLTAQPSALASALTKISGEMGRIPSRDLREAEPYNAFFFAPAVAPGFTLSSLFSTHPPLEKRLDQLAEISATLSRP